MRVIGMDVHRTMAVVAVLEDGHLSAGEALLICNNRLRRSAVPVFSSGAKKPRERMQTTTGINEQLTGTFSADLEATLSILPMYQAG
jgi:hypothetical protein